MINARNPVLDKCRLLIEAYFGRMASVLGTVSAAYPLSHQYFRDYIRAVCFLTNASVYLQKLRGRGAEHHSAMELMWGGRLGTGERHRESVKMGRGVEGPLVERGAPNRQGQRAGAWQVLELPPRHQGRAAQTLGEVRRLSACLAKQLRRSRWKWMGWPRRRHVGQSASHSSPAASHLNLTRPSCPSLFPLCASVLWPSRSRRRVEGSERYRGWRTGLWRR